MSQSQNRDFAFGRNEVENKSCPALTAGMDPCETGDCHIPGLLEAAEWYDCTVKRNYDVSGSAGIIDESVAKSAWIEIIEDAIERDRYEAQAAIDVAVELGWIDREDYEL